MTAPPSWATARSTVSVAVADTGLGPYMDADAGLRPGLVWGPDSTLADRSLAGFSQPSWNAAKRCLAASFTYDRQLAGGARPIAYVLADDVATITAFQVSGFISKSQVTPNFSLQSGNGSGE